MAEIPRAIAQNTAQFTPVPRPNFENTGADVVFHAIRKQEQLEEDQRLQTYDIGVQTELRQAIVTARTKAAQINDPDQYQQVYEQELSKVLPPLQPQVEGDVKQSLILGRRYSELIGGEARHIAEGVTARHRDTALASVQQLAQLGRERVNEGADPNEEIQKYDQQIDVTPFLMRDEQERLKEHFRDTISRDVLYDKATKDPVGFAQAVESGGFKGLSTQFLDEGLSIASRILADRDRRDAKADQGRSDAAERAFTARAQAHTLDEADLQQAAVWYKWDKNKVDQILRLQYGIKMGSPDAERLIANALAPVNKVAPTMEDVKQTERNLAALGDRVSSTSTEYTQAVNKVRGIAEYLARQSGPDNRAKVEANRRLNNMIMMYRADDRRDTDFQAQLGQIRETMRTMPADKLQQYLDNLEKLWKVDTQQQQIDKAAQDRLLGVGKK